MSLKDRFDELQQKHPDWSSWSCFYVATRKKEYSTSVIKKWFTKLVDRDDYAQSERRSIIAYLLNR